MEAKSKLFAVCHYLREKEGSTINLWKLCALLYYVQSWTLVWQNEKMFDATFEAWQTRVSVRELYEAQKDAPAEYKAVDIAFIPETSYELSEEDKKWIDEVYENYAKFGASALIKMIQGDEPWREARNGIPLASHEKPVISEETMQYAYRELVAVEEFRRTYRRRHGRN